MTAAADDLRVHLHFTMTGRYPLRLLDLLFLGDRALGVEYGYVTPADLLLGRASRRADSFAETVTSEGPAAAIDTAERVRTVPYDELESIHAYDGGRFGRKKVSLRRSTGSDLSVRVHGPVDLAAFTEALDHVVRNHDVTVERSQGLGLDPTALGTVRRFVDR